MKMMRITYLFLISGLIVFFLTGNQAPAFAESRLSDAADAPDLFQLFAANAAGRYFTVDQEDTVILDVIPAFGHLFASVGRYMFGKSLYTYYAAEILPLCPAESESCPYMHTQNSFDVYIRFFSNMSFAGSYWPGETFQRLTIMSGGLMISDHVGDGDGLISKTGTLLSRNDNVPSIFPYGPDEAEKMYGTGSTVTVPDVLTGSWKASWQAEDSDIVVQLSLETDGTMVMLREEGTDQPPLLLKGGFSVSGAEEDAVILCYMMSSPSSGLMPYTGCVTLGTEGDSLTAGHSPDGDDELILPPKARTVKYERN